MSIFELTVLIVTLNLEIAIVSMNIGTQLGKVSSMIILTVIFAFFHCLASFAGFIIGNALSGLFGTVSRYVSSAILAFVGCMLLKTSLDEPESGISDTNILLIFLGAGIEDFAGGVSVGVDASGGSAALFMLLFFILSIPLNLLAFGFGKALKKHIEVSINLITGLLLISLGILSAFRVI